VAQVIDELLDRTGYREALEAERTIEAQGRLENLDELVEAARQYDVNAADGGSVGEFLQQASLVADADTMRDDEGLVTLMTMHNAKGLEFPIVFMIGMEDGVFPHSRSIEENQIEEERRLAYVGLTRAMRDLTLTYARRRNAYGGAAAHSLRSRFLDELPRELTDQPDRAARGLPVPGRVASWSAAAAASAESEGDAPIFRVGDDVVHANLGEGVVTGLQPGGIVVVRFAGESRDRSLMADVAPIRKV
jgi:DNA helicase-2/ATP-dependent DNA helicase PcrA